MASKAQSGDVDQTVTSGTVAKPSPFDSLLRMMEMEATAAAENNTFSGDDLVGILSAESDDDIWDADERGPLNAQDIAGCEIEIIGVTVKWSRGDSDIATPFQVRDEHGTTKKMYLIVSAVRISDSGDNRSTMRLPDIGEVFEFNTSARFVVAKIMQFYRLGRIDADTHSTLECMVRATDLGSGQAVLKLRPLPKRAQRSTIEN